jgi:hypothetical protein
MLTPPRPDESLGLGGQSQTQGSVGAATDTNSSAQGLLPYVDDDHETLVGPQKCRRDEKIAETHFW